LKRRRIPSKTKVLIGIPCPLDGKVSGANSMFVESANERGIADIRRMGARSPEDARTGFIQEVLANDKYTHLFFLDADTWPYEQFAIERLLKHDKDVVAGITPTKKVENGKYTYYWSVKREKTIKRKPDEMPKTMFKASHVGGTTILIKRDVLKKLKRPYQKMVRDEHGIITQSEDYYFCDRIKEAGYDIWVDPEIKCGHAQTVDIGRYGI